MFQGNFRISRAKVTNCPPMAISGRQIHFLWLPENFKMKGKVAFKTRVSRTIPSVFRRPAALGLHCQR